MAFRDRDSPALRSAPAAAATAWLRAHPIQRRLDDLRDVHARPYDAPARGRWSAFWRTLREGCLDHLGSVASLHDVEVRLLAFLDRHYLVAPHASLMGRSPGVVFAAASRPADGLDEAKLREAFMVRERRRVRRDTTVSILGTDYELDRGFLAGRVVTVAYSLLDGSP